MVAVRGEVDLHTAPDLADELSALIGRGAREIVVDLSASTFIDSTTLGVLLHALKRLESRRGRLVIVSNDRRILRTFEITGLDRRFRLEDSLADALELAAA